MTGLEEKVSQVVATFRGKNLTAETMEKIRDDVGLVIVEHLRTAGFLDEVMTVDLDFEVFYHGSGQIGVRIWHVEDEEES